MGNLLQSDDTLAGLGVSTFQYDPMDRLVEKTTVAGVVAYEYDLSGMKTRVTDPNSEATTHAYDEAGRLIRATVLDTPNRENYFHHDRSGLIERKVLADNKVVSYYAYDVAGRLSSLVNRDDAAAVISSFVYQRNPNGAVTQVEHEDGEFTYYAYDALDRLIEERRVQNPTVYGFAYQYDAASNRVQKVDLVEDETTNYTVDARNLIQSEVTGADEIAYEYDQAQRMKRRASADEATVFTHNQRDLPTKVEFEVESGTPEATREFKYNGTGERVAIVGELGAGYETRLAYDGTRLLTEKDEFDNTFGRYRWGSPQHGGALVESSNPAEAGPEEGPVMDERGSVDRLVGASGRVIFDRFGVELAGSLSSSTRTRFVSPFFLRLKTSERLSLTPGGIYLASASGIAPRDWSRILGVGRVPRSDTQEFDTQTEQGQESNDDWPDDIPSPVIDPLVVFRCRAGRAEVMQDGAIADLDAPRISSPTPFYPRLFAWWHARHRAHVAFDSLGPVQGDKAPFCAFAFAYQFPVNDPGFRAAAPIRSESRCRTCACEMRVEETWSRSFRTFMQERHDDSIGWTRFDDHMAHVGRRPQWADTEGGSLRINILDTAGRGYGRLAPLFPHTISNTDVPTAIVPFLVAPSWFQRVAGRGANTFENLLELEHTAKVIQKHTGDMLASVTIRMRLYAAWTVGQPSTNHACRLLEPFDISYGP